MKRITLLLIALGLSAQMGFAQGGRIVCDETCRIEYQKTETALPKQAEKAKAAANTTAAKTTATKTAAAKPAAKSADKTPTPTVPGYAVVSPVGRTSVEMITQAPRLESLEGKTIAVVGVSFMTGVTHPEIKRLIKEHYPSAKVLLLDEIDDYFRKQNWTDGLPIVPPTFDKVTEYMKYMPYGYDQTVAVLPIAHRDTKAWHVAVNAVMAGCKPEYMPILIALTKGLGDGNFRRTLASTHAWAPYCWINGPIARQRPGILRMISRPRSMLISRKAKRSFLSGRHTTKNFAPS